MPEAAPVRYLPGNDHLSCIDIDNSKTGWLLSGTARSPSSFLTGIRTANRCSWFGFTRCFRNFPVSHDGNSHFSGTDDGLMCNPLKSSLRIKRTETRSVRIDDPGALRRFSSRFPAENYLSGYPWIAL